MQYKINSKYTLEPGRGYLIEISKESELSYCIDYNIANALAEHLSYIGYDAEYVNIFDDEVSIVNGFLDRKSKLSPLEFGLLYLSNLSYVTNNTIAHKVKNLNKIVVIENYNSLLNKDIFITPVKLWFSRYMDSVKADYIFNLVTDLNNFKSLYNYDITHNINVDQPVNTVIDDIMSKLEKGSATTNEQDHDS